MQVIAEERSEIEMVVKVTAQLATNSKVFLKGRNHRELPAR